MAQHGWGGTNSGLVFQIEIPIIDHRTCQEAYAPVKNKVTRDMICAGEKEGRLRGWHKQGTSSQAVVQSPAMGGLETRSVLG